MDEVALLKDIEWIKSELKNPGSVIHRLYASNTPKKDLILLWATKLEELSVVSPEIKTTEISTSIKRELKGMGLENAVWYVNDVLPFKYKNADHSHTDRRDEPSENGSEDAENLLAADCKKANTNYISFLKRTIETFKTVIHQLERNIVLEPQIPEKEMEEYFIHWDHYLQRMNEVLDGRDKVLTSTQHLLIYHLAQTTLNNTFANYVLHVRELASLTSKQAGKILRGYVPKMQALYEPKNRTEAIDSGFYGLQCGECGSWRMAVKWIAEKHDNLLHCFACDYNQKPITLKLPQRTMI